MKVIAKALDHVWLVEMSTHELRLITDVRESPCVGSTYHEVPLQVQADRDKGNKLDLLKRTLGVKP